MINSGLFKLLWNETTEACNYTLQASVFILHSFYLISINYFLYQQGLLGSPA